MSKYIIHACPQRMWYVTDYLVPSMRDQGIDPLVVCDTGAGNLETCMKIFMNMNHLGGTWHLQDDIIICKDFAERTRALVESKPDVVICGFVVRGDGNAKYVGYVKPVEKWWSFPCIYIPNKLACECAEWFYHEGAKKHPARTQARKYDDYFFKKFLKICYPDYPVLNLKPNLVDHIDYLIGDSVINRGRQSKDVRALWFDDQDLVNELEAKLKRNT